MPKVTNTFEQVKCLDRDEFLWCLSLINKVNKPYLVSGSINTKMKEMKSSSFGFKKCLKNNNLCKRKQIPVQCRIFLKGEKI